MTIVRVYTSQILTIIILHYSYLAINTNQTSPLLYYITIIFMISCPCIIQIHIIAYYIILIMSFTLINRLHNAAIPYSKSKSKTLAWLHQHKIAIFLNWWTPCVQRNGKMTENQGILKFWRWAPSNKLSNPQSGTGWFYPQLAPMTDYQGGRSCWGDSFENPFLAIYCSPPVKYLLPPTLLII